MEVVTAGNEKKALYLQKIRGDSVVGKNTESPLNGMSDDEVYDLVKSGATPRGAMIIARQHHRKLLEGAVSLEDVKAKADVNRRRKANEMFDINSRFKFIREFTRMVLRRNLNSLLITGSGGLGKSRTVLDEIRHLTPGEDYVKTKGNCTPKALFNLLKDNPNQLIIFDDCDSPLKDPTSLNILKSALDSDDRWVSWRTTRVNTDDDGEPQDDTFEFKGACIFVSNLPFESIDQAILSRSIFVDVSMTPREKISRMMTILPDLDVPNPEEERLEVLRVMNSLRDEIKDLNIRTLVKCLAIRRDEEVGDWQKSVEYILRMGIGE